MSRPAHPHHDAPAPRGATVGLPVLMLVALAMSLASAAVEAAGPARPAVRIELRGLIEGVPVGQVSFAVRTGVRPDDRQPLPAAVAALGTPIWHEADTPVRRACLLPTQLDLPPPARR